MASAGMYEEAAELLRQTDKASLPTHLMPDYYNACHKLYTELSFYTLDDSFKKHYQALATHYDDSLMQVLLPSSPSIWNEERRGGRCRPSGRSLEHQ